MNKNSNKLISQPAGAVQHKTAGPYSPVLIVEPGQLIVLSGQAAIDPEGQLVGESIEEQTLYMMENCKKQLATAGCDLSDVFKATIFLKDIADWSDFNTVYESYFERPMPVRTAIQTGLLGGLLIEIEIWAVKS